MWSASGCPAYIYISLVKLLIKYTEGGDKTLQYSYLVTKILVVILPNWVPVLDNWVYQLPFFLFCGLGGEEVPRLVCASEVFWRET